MDSTENIISFCTGYGGIELGLHRVIENLRTICYVEVETFAVANLVAKIEQGKMDAAPIWSDIKTFPAKIFRDKVHGIVGGYPCQPFSTAGKREGSKDSRHLWPYIRESISIIRPEWCFFENVAGHIELGLREVLLDLEELGYRVENDRGEPTWGLFTASEVGAPHERKRLFILAYDNNRASNSAIITKPIRQTQLESGDDSGESELAESECSGYIHGKPQEQPTERRLNAQRESKPDSELADTDKERTQRPEPERTAQARRQIDEQSYPARPGQPQYEWEEPRTVV